MKTNINSQSMLKIEALAVYNHDLFDAMADVSYSLHLLENGTDHLKARYGVSCGQLYHLPCNEVGLTALAYATMLNEDSR